MQKSWIAAALLLAAGCDLGRGDSVPAEVRTQRLEAARTACIAGELLRRADQNLDLIEGSLAEAAEGSNVPPAIRQATVSAYEFARVYHQHAQLQAARLAQMDSAFNRSRRPADSLRHVRAAEGYALRPPAPGTVEANAIENYRRDFAAIYQNPDHPCNWED